MYGMSRSVDNYLWDELCNHIFITYTTFSFIYVREGLLHMYAIHDVKRPTLGYCLHAMHACQLERSFVHVYAYDK